ncbi:MAG: [FeFe] hydrogenase H-cluster radical SAM maturase HydE [Ruminococcaceae bacterium]|nr:[FeFe] hydrogenase H-cluster radical SAM maturase HydE [Oscillospiraceae bacterium]
MDKLKKLVDKLEKEQRLSKEEFIALINGRNEELAEYLFKKASDIRDKNYGKRVFVRGLIEFTNYCKNNCLYCGIRAGNKKAERYRLSKEEILECCAHGYGLGFRTFVLQGGEDPFFTDEMMVDIVKNIKKDHPDCAVTLSIGEKSRESYEKFRLAGVDRYLLRHETANPEHYAKLHPENLSYENRIRCLHDLKGLGFQTGCGFMVGSPYQTTENLANDMVFLQEFRPHMVGIGPFISHKDTPFANERSGTLELTLFMLGLVRLTLPHALLPSTTALGTIAPDGREKGVLAGGNVVMPNLSPLNVRKKYMLYDNKISTGDEAAESLNNLKLRMKSIGYEVVTDRGDYFER